MEEYRQHNDGLQVIKDHDQKHQFRIIRRNRENTLAQIIF